MGRNRLGIDGPYQENTSYQESVPAAPFLAWWDDWLAERDRVPAHEVWHGRQLEGPGRALWSQHAICQEAGVSEKAIRRARREGRVTLAVVDRLLTRASHGETTVNDLYPYEEYPAPLFNPRSHRPQ